MSELVLHALQGYARHFPIEKGKRRVLKAAASLLPRKPRLGTLKMNDLRVTCDLSKHMQREMYFFGAYEEPDVRRWAELAKQASVIVDIGANVGIYSLVAASSNARASVHAFEPTSDIADELDSNIELNGLSNIAVNRLAVADVTGMLHLNYCDDPEGGNGGMNFVSAEKHESTFASIPSTTLDDYCTSRGIERIDLLKADVEGGEYAVLMGANGLLARRAIGTIFIELIGWSAERAGRTPQDVIDVLRGYGYSVAALIHGGKVPLTDAPGYEGNFIAEAQI